MTPRLKFLFCNKYYGAYTYEEGEIFHGTIIGIKDVITFQGTNHEEIAKAFQDSLRDYLQWCRERKEEPEKTLMGID